MNTNNTDMTIQEITNKLATLRRERGITQKNLAELLNVTQGAITHLETGKENNTSLRALIPYAQALGFKISFYLEPIEDCSE